MAISIERKFLVNAAAFESAKNLKSDTFEETIEQGYLYNGSSRSVRVRIRNNKGKLTFKGSRSLGGMARNELRLSVPLFLAKLGIKLVGKTISKTRTYIRYDDVDWKIDKYEDGNVLIGKTIGNTRFYELNRRYPFYKELLQLLKRAKSAYETILIEELDDYNKRERFRKKDKPLEYQASHTNYSPAVAHAM